MSKDLLLSTESETDFILVDTIEEIKPEPKPEEPKPEEPKPEIKQETAPPLLESVQEPKEQPKAETRGRKKGTTKEVIEAKKQETTQAQEPKKTISLFDELKTHPSANKLTNVVNNLPTTGTPQPITIDASKFVNGSMLLIVMDAMMPFALVKIISFFNEDAKKIDRKKLKLDKDEKEELKELANEVAKYVFSGMNPIAAFFVVCSAIYYNKIDQELNK